MKKLFSTFFFLFILSVNAQVFNGEILIRDHSQYYLNQVFITNLNEHKTVSANYLGEFSIAAKPGDVIRFTSIVTDRHDVKVTAELLENRKNYIELKIAYYDIQEVVISKFKPSGNLRRDVNALKVDAKTAELQKMIGLPQPKGNGAPPIQPMTEFANGGLAFNLESIYDMISGERKKKERALKYEQMTNSISQIRQFYGNQYFTNLRIPEALIDNFLQFVYTSDNISGFVAQKNFDAVAVYIEKYQPIYLRRVRNSSLTEGIN